MPAPQPQTPQERARQLSFLQNLLSEDPGILRKLLLHPAARMSERTGQAMQGQFVPRQDYGSTAMDTAALYSPAALARPQMGAVGAGMRTVPDVPLLQRGADTGVTPDLPPGDFERAASGVRPLSVSKHLNNPELAQYVLGAAQGRMRDAGQVQQARQMAQSILDDLNMTYEGQKGYFNEGAVVMVGGVPVPLRVLHELTSPGRALEEQSPQNLPAMMGNRS